MKRSTSRWTTAFAAAALIGVPAAGWSQTPPAAASQPPAAQQPADAPAQQGAAEHIQKAEAALNDIPTSTLPARAKSRVADLKRQLNSLEKSAEKSASSKPKDTWAKDVAAIDKTLTELLGPAAASGAAAPPAATGTTGQSKSESLTIDDTTKAKLLEVRQHVTAFATSMSGSGASSPSAPSSEPSPEPAAAAAAQAQAASPTPTAESTPPASASVPASASAPSAQSAAAAQSPAASSAAPAEQTQAQAPTAEASSQSDEEGAKRHLTAARDSLAQLTQLPAAAQLTGDTRTQVSQLIGNFNELITSKADWRASYDKVAANVTAIIGAESAPVEAAAAAPAGTPGAVGTSGSTAAALDPAIKGKLVEFRTHLMAFEKAAGDAPSGPSSPSSSAMTPSSSAPPASSAAPSASPSSPSSSAAPSASPSSPSPEPAASSSPAEQGAAAAQSAGKMSQDNPISHIEAIEAIIGSGSKLTLEQAQVEQIRTHLAQLRKAVDKK